LPLLARVPPCKFSADAEEIMEFAPVTTSETLRRAQNLQIFVQISRLVAHKKKFGSGMTVASKRKPAPLVFTTSLCGFCGILISGVLAAAQDTAAQYPSQPVHIIVPFAPGGASDVAARVVGGKLAQMWHATVVVENRPGATGAIAAEYVAKVAPDGLTLLMGTGSVNSIFPAVKHNLPFDTLRDFAAVSNVFVSPNILVVHSSVPANTVAELIALAKARPNPYSFGSGGAGNSGHLCGEMFKQMAGVEMVHVPYKGTTLAVADLLAGHIQVMFDNLPTLWPSVQQGKLRALGLTSAARDPLAPGVPTIAETLPGYEATIWAGLLAPASTPAAIIEKISAAVQEAIRLPEVIEKFQAVGATPVGDSSAHFAQFLAEDIARWRAVVVKAGVRVE
jgi:tripartite-type tricarboxylate transporter receptor subunit TctC